MPAQVKLTLREIDILHYIAAGKTNWEIGMVLGITENTVKKTLQKILAKYQTSSRTHAVALAIRQGAILP
jgi:LuxR family quorum sensing-dependent transcriptional regulator